ncbi:hypothetical protein BDE02_14G096900 [Populus trichocarpa]|nr:hypothetical protein BDE02_14G096900 [Populus trichocarpa]
MYVHDRYLQLICPRVFSWSLAFWSEKTEEQSKGLSLMLDEHGRAEHS